MPDSTPVVLAANGSEGCYAVACRADRADRCLPTTLCKLARFPMVLMSWQACGRAPVCIPSEGDGARPQPASPLPRWLILALVVEPTQRVCFSMICHRWRSAARTHAGPSPRPDGTPVVLAANGSEGCYAVARGADRADSCLPSTVCNLARFRMVMISWQACGMSASLYTLLGRRRPAVADLGLSES